MLELINCLAKPGKHWVLGQFSYQRALLYKRGDLVLYDENDIQLRKHKDPTPAAVAAGEGIDSLLERFQLLHFDWVEIWVEGGQMMLSIDSHQLDKSFKITKT